MAVIRNTDDYGRAVNASGSDKGQRLGEQHPCGYSAQQCMDHKAPSEMRPVRYGVPGERIMGETFTFPVMTGRMAYNPCTAARR